VSRGLESFLIGKGKNSEKVAEIHKKHRKKTPIRKKCKKVGSPVRKGLFV
jgi:hypothetical protein